MREIKAHQQTSAEIKRLRQKYRAHAKLFLNVAYEAGVAGWTVAPAIIFCEWFHSTGRSAAEQSARCAAATIINKWCKNRPALPIAVCFTSLVTHARHDANASRLLAEWDAADFEEPRVYQSAFEGSPDARDLIRFWSDRHDGLARLATADAWLGEHPGPHADAFTNNACDILGVLASALGENSAAKTLAIRAADHGCRAVSNVMLRWLRERDEEAWSCLLQRAQAIAETISRRLAIPGDAEDQAQDAIVAFYDLLENARVIPESYGGLIYTIVMRSVMSERRKAARRKRRLYKWLERVERVSYDAARDWGIDCSELPFEQATPKELEAALLTGLGHKGSLIDRNSWTRFKGKARMRRDALNAEDQSQ